MSGVRSQKVYSERLRRHLLKLLSVLFSISLWFYVLNSKPIEVEVKLPLVLIPSAERALSEMPVSEIIVKVRGSRVFVRNLFDKGEKVFIDIKKRGKKTKDGVMLKILPSDIPHALGIEVMEIQPSLLEIKLEKRRIKKVQIKPFLVGTVPNELEMIKYEIVPSSLKISGPRSLISTIEVIETNPIELDKLEGDGRVKVLLKNLDPRLKAEEVLEEAEFLYRVRPKKANFTLKNVKIRFLTSSSTFVAKVRTVNLDVLLPEGMDKALSAKDVKIIAEIPEDSKGELRIKLRAELPEGVHLLQIYPESINVRL